MTFRKTCAAVAAAAAMTWMSAGSAQVQSTEAAFTSSSAASATAAGVAVDVSGIVTGSPESVAFDGKARVVSRLAPDPDFHSPRLVLQIDMTKVDGTGRSSGAQYIVQAEEVVQRRVASSHVVTFSFPFLEKGKHILEARSGKVSFNLSFDVDTGAITQASASVGSVN